MDLKAWIGRTELLTDFVAAVPVAALAATLDRPAERPPAGMRLPPLWHWLYFLPLAPRSGVGPDGHPKRGGFLPPIELPRRMWAGSQVEFTGDIHIGDVVTRRSIIEDVTEKSGRTGTLVFVKVRHEITREGSGEVLVREGQDLVYREAPAPDAVPPPPKPAPASSAWERRWDPDEVMLFRYSALTFNGHRIHYDHPYVTQVEGYPGLVVHGPLIATLLLDLLASERPRARVGRFEFRAVRPCFAGRPLHCCGTPEADGRTVRLWARDAEGCVAMEATATLD